MAMTSELLLNHHRTVCNKQMRKLRGWYECFRRIQALQTTNCGESCILCRAAPQPLDLDLSEEKVLSVLEFSSHGAARSDQGARMLRSEPQQAFLGEVLEDCPFVQGDCCGGILY